MMMTGPGEHATPATIMKILDIPQSGKLGTSVSLHTRYGQSRRQFIIPPDPRTPPQLFVRGLLGRVVSRWRGLTDDQRDVWTAGGRHIHSQPRLGQSGHLSGCQFYTQINFNLAYIHEPQAVQPPDRPDFGPNPVGQLFITNVGGVIGLKLSVPSASAGHIIVLGTFPRSAGVAYIRRFVILGLLPPRKQASATSGSFTLTGSASRRSASASSSAQRSKSTAGKTFPNQPAPSFPPHSRLSGSFQRSSDFRG